MGILGLVHFHVRVAGMIASEFVTRLDGLKRTGAGRWLGKCPAHDDKSPSLSITETRDGKILLHCFAGCGAGEIVQALGLELADLFPEKFSHNPGRAPRFPAHEVLTALASEIEIVALLILRWFDPNKTWDLDHYERMLLSNARIQNAVNLLGGRHYG